MLMSNLCNNSQPLGSRAHVTRVRWPSVAQAGNPSTLEMEARIFKVRSCFNKNQNKGGR